MMLDVDVDRKSYETKEHLHNALFHVLLCCAVQGFSTIRCTLKYILRHSRSSIIESAYQILNYDEKHRGCKIL